MNKYDKWLPEFAPIGEIADPMEECEFKIKLYGRYSQNDRFLNDFTKLLNKYNIAIILKPIKTKKY